MFLLNLTWIQFAAVLGGVSAGVLALYLWDRSKRRVTVPTLRFWMASEQAAQVKHRKRIQQPLSLLLQLLSIALLLLALAQPRLGTPAAAPRDHVLILDTSAWMAARSGAATLMDKARETARGYVRAISAGDRVMLVRADALATPATAFEQNRAVLEQSIAESRPGSTALDLAQAIEFARQAQKLQGGPGGEIVYVGPGRTAAPPAGPGASSAAARLRVLPVNDVSDNCGLRRIGVRRSANDPDVWDILVVAHNYGPEPRTLPLVLGFGGSPVASRRLALAPLSDTEANFQYRTRAAGVLEARLITNDVFPEDDRATVEVPAQGALNVDVYSDDPDLLRPVLAASTQVNARFRKPSEYQPSTGAHIVLFDRFNPPVRPEVDAIWIEPPPDGAPVPLRTTVSDAMLVSWKADHPLAAGIKSPDVRLASAEVFRPAEDEIAIANVEAGPVVVAHPAKPKFVVLGFQPVRGALRYQLTTPLLFANILRWMAPDIFRRPEVNAGSPGTVSVDLGQESQSERVQVIAANKTELPYTLENGNLRFFAGTAGPVRVVAGERQMDFSFTLPELAEAKWTPPGETLKGLPHYRFAAAAAYVELWPWLALAGALGLLSEWILFGRARAARIRDGLRSGRTAITGHARGSAA